MIRNFVKRHMLWVALGAVLVPLGVLLSLQYTWLVSLARTSAIAERASLGNFLDAISNDIEHFYVKQTWRVLNIPEELVAHSNTAKIKSFFDKREVRGAKYLFVVTMTEEHWGETIFYDPNKRNLALPDDPIYQAVRVALAPWKILATSGAPLQQPHEELQFDNKNPDNRIVLKPITQDECQIVGVAGMIVDNELFRAKVLPKAIKSSLPEFFERDEKQNMALAIVDSRGKIVLGKEIEEESVKEVSQPISWVWSDWRMILTSRHDTPDQVARSNFWLNISMSVLLAFVLMTGIIVALRTASREIYLSQMKSDFVSNVSHELRTPLASIRVFGEFFRLGRVKDGKKAAEYGEYIETESRRLTQLINNILDFSKIESGVKSYQFETANVEDVISETVKTLEVGLRHKGFHLSYRQPDRPMPELSIDPDAIGQALANLVDNAVKYSNGSSEIEILLERDEDSVVIAVRDHGIGISRDEQKKIFDRFHRVSTGLVHDVKGSGLGLSIVSHIIQSHGGRISVESEPDKGSRFAMHLPILEQGERQPDREVSAAQVSPAGQVGKS